MLWNAPGQYGGNDMTVLIAGAGIAGLAMGLTCQQIGVPFRIYEQTRTLRPLGVGINLQPNAVREIQDMGLADDLHAIGVATQEWGLFTKHGLEIWTEPRGRAAGYLWPQYSVHRGALQMMLHAALCARAGPECVVTGARVAGFDQGADHVAAHIAHADGRTETLRGTALIAADGIHSAIRRQMHPDEGPPIWNGAVLWRGVTRAKPFRTGASMALIGHATQRIVAYPISHPRPDTGLSEMNWIAERWFDPSAGWQKEDWTRPADVADVLPAFEDWRFGWLDAPDLIRRADAVYEYPMVDRDPLDRWTHGRVTLIGDAAHPTYPVGSNGASQAIVDARNLGAALLAHAAMPDALAAYEDRMRPLANAIVTANRGSGPDAVLQLIEERCGGRFERLSDVASADELARHAASYKRLAGLAIDTLNAAPATIPADKR